jgi:hypothetical protein
MRSVFKESFDRFPELFGSIGKIVNLDKKSGVQITLLFSLGKIP